MTFVGGVDCKKHILIVGKCSPSKDMSAVKIQLR